MWSEYGNGRHRLSRSTGLIRGYAWVCEVDPLTVFATSWVNVNGARYDSTEVVGAAELSGLALHDLRRIAEVRLARCVSRVAVLIAEEARAVAGSAEVVLNGGGW